MDVLSRTGCGSVSVLLRQEDKEYTKDMLDLVLIRRSTRAASLCRVIINFWLITTDCTKTKFSAWESLIPWEYDTHYSRRPVKL